VNGNTVENVLSIPSFNVNGSVANSINPTLSHPDLVNIKKVVHTAGVMGGSPYYAALKTDGTLLAFSITPHFSYINGFAEMVGWNDIVDIAIIRGCLVGLKSDGTIVTSNSPREQRNKLYEEFSELWYEFIGNLDGFDEWFEEHMLTFHYSLDFDVDVTNWKLVTDISTDEDYKVLSFTLDGGNAKFRLFNNTNETKSLHFIVAEYNGGRLVNAALHPIELVNRYNAAFPVQETDNDIKFMLWEANTNAPIIMPQTFTR
jgi:hypothetical protein